MVGDRGQEEFEEIRILGLEVPEDGVEPGRSVFDEEDSVSEELPHWTEEPATIASDDDPWSEIAQTPKWSDEALIEHESQQHVGDLDGETAAIFFDEEPSDSDPFSGEFNPPIFPPDNTEEIKTEKTTPVFQPAAQSNTPRQSVPSRNMSTALILSLIHICR